MAKKTVASLKNKDAKSFTKVVRFKKNEATGSYSTTVDIMPKDSVKDFLCLLYTSDAADD